ncbi:MAG: hypothetical protein C5B49_00100 [Bdellovibrio sp.]|nr:MAG: hypothetical protein C5B49_00100 [Bdellovibrio sp.]
MNFKSAPTLIVAFCFIAASPAAFPAAISCGLLNKTWFPVAPGSADSRNRPESPSESPRPTPIARFVAKWFQLEGPLRRGKIVTLSDETRNVELAFLGIVDNSTTVLAEETVAPHEATEPPALPQPLPPPET